MPRDQNDHAGSWPQQPGTHRQTHTTGYPGQWNESAPSRDLVPNSETSAAGEIFGPRPEQPGAEEAYYEEDWEEDWGYDEEYPAAHDEWEEEEYDELGYREDEGWGRLDDDEDAEGGAHAMDPRPVYSSENHLLDDCDDPWVEWEQLVADRAWQDDAAAEEEDLECSKYVVRDQEDGYYDELDPWDEDPDYEGFDYPEYDGPDPDGLMEDDDPGLWAEEEPQYDPEPDIIPDELDEEEDDQYGEELLDEGSDRPVYDYDEHSIDDSDDPWAAWEDHVGDEIDRYEWEVDERDRRSLYRDWDDWEYGDCDYDDWDDYDP